MAVMCEKRTRRAVTFNSVDELLAFMEQIAADRFREFETRLLTEEQFKEFDDLEDGIDRLREWEDERMREWLPRTRRQLLALNIRFPTTLTTRRTGA